MALILKNTSEDWYMTAFGIHEAGGPGSTRREPFNSTPMGVNPIPFGSPHVRPMGVRRTCGEPNEIKKNAHSKCITALSRVQAPPTPPRPTRPTPRTRHCALQKCHLIRNDPGGLISYSDLIRNDPGGLISDLIRSALG
jgi:hypothetical protein